MPRTLSLAVLLALVLLAVGSGPAGAKDDAPLVTRIFPVGSLGPGRTDFIPGQPPWVGPHMVSDEMYPLFGAEGEEPILPLGTVDEVIEYIKNAVDPWFWEEREGADVRSLGEHRIVARATPAVLDRVGSFLARMETLHSTVVTLDVHAVRLTAEERLALGPAGAALDDKRVAALIESEDAGPSVSFSALAAARATVYAGTRRAWIGDADVEVAENSQSPDPIVLVANLGLIADMRAMPSPDGKHVLVGMRVALSRIGELRDSPTGASGIVETPAYDLAVFRSALHVPAGAWVLADGVAGGPGETSWTLLVRATPRRTEVTAGGFDVPAFPPRTIGPMQLRYFPLPVLSSAVAWRIGRPLKPVPSNYTPPEPPELPEPWPIMPEEAIVDLLREIGGDSAWEDPAHIEVRNRVLIARNVPSLLGGIHRLLAAFRTGLIYSTDTTLEVVEMPVGVARHLATGGALDDRAADLLAEALQSGQAERLESVTVTSMTGARNAVTSGRLVHYIQDYEVEIAQEAAIFNPVTLHFLDGVCADVTPVCTADRSAVQLTLRFLRAHQNGPMRTRRAGPVPEIDLPEVETFEIHAETLVPVGRTSVVGAWGEGGRCRLLLVTPTLRR